MPTGPKAQAAIDRIRNKRKHLLSSKDDKFGSECCRADFDDERQFEYAWLMADRALHEAEGKDKEGLWLHYARLAQIDRNENMYADIRDGDVATTKKIREEEEEKRAADDKAADREIEASLEENNVADDGLTKHQRYEDKRLKRYKEYYVLVAQRAREEKDKESGWGVRIMRIDTNIQNNYADEEKRHKKRMRNQQKLRAEKKASRSCKK